MDELQIFNNPRFGEMRTFRESDGSVTFCATDAAKSLGYINTNDAIRVHCKPDGVAFHDIIDNMGRTQSAKFITRGNLIRLAATSELPGADAFESWIFDEVIPQVMQTGTYTSQPRTPVELLAAEAQQMVEIERKANAALEASNRTSRKLDSALDVLASCPEPDWQAATGDKIKSMAQEYGLSYPVLFGDMYKELEDTARCNLQSRVARLQGRMKKAGATHKERAQITKLHVIGLDPALKLAFDGIVRRYHAKYAVERAGDLEAAS